MRVLLLIFAVVNLALLGVLVVWNVRATPHAFASVRDDKTAALLARLDSLVGEEEKRGAGVNDVRKELAVVRKELADLRSAVGTLDAKTLQTGDEARATRTRCERIGTVVETMEKKLEKSDAKQLTDLSAELRRLNEQFKRVIDFAAGRSGL